MKNVSTPKPPAQSDRKGILWLSALAGMIGGLCCLTPIVLVLLGLATVAVAADLGNVLYGDYRWVFRGAGLLFLVAALTIYFRTQGICTLDQARRQRNRIVNVSLLVLIAGTAVYVFWTYIVLHYWGIAAGLPWAQYSDEYWAIPLIVALVAAFFGLLWRQRRSRAKLAADSRLRSSAADWVHSQDAPGIRSDH